MGLSGIKWNALIAQLMGLFVLVLAVFTVQAKSFHAFESGPVRPLAITPDGRHLLAVNTPDNRLEVYRINEESGSLQHVQSVPVGLEPVAVAARNNTQVWVANHLSDSVSIVNLQRQPMVVEKTLLVGDEPRDIVFAGANNQRAFITTAHRGQQRTSSLLSAVTGAGDPELTKEGVNRADVWVFDAQNTGPTLGGVPLRIVSLFGDTPRALAVSADKQTVFAAIFHSGNQTTVVHDGVVCDSRNGDPGNCTNAEDNLQVPGGLLNGQLPGGLLAPRTNASNDFTPETGLIVKYNNQARQWQDVPFDGATPRNWTNGVRFNLPDYDVFAIDAGSLDVRRQFAHVGTILYNMVVNPVTGQLYVSNTEANNARRYEGDNYRPDPALPEQRTVRGELHRSQISVIDPAAAEGNIRLRHLNKHIDYNQYPAPTAVRDASLATPMDMAISNDGRTVYIAAFGSSRLGVFDAAQLEDNNRWQQTRIQEQSRRYIPITGGGVSGVVVHPRLSRLYVSTRFDNGVSIVDAGAGRELEHLTFFNPEPESITRGRPLLYDATRTSSNGEVSCASCHVFGDLDSLAWDLGNPTERNTESTLCMSFEASVRVCMEDPDSPACGLPIFADEGFRRGVNGNGKLRDFASIKGPMTTQTLKGIQNHGHLHWRGDRVSGAFGTDNTGSKVVDGRRENADNCFDPNADIDYDERLSFKNFVVAFEGLQGMAPGTRPNEAQMDQFTDFTMQLMLPPNPIRALDNSLNQAQENGRRFFFGTLDPANPDKVTRHGDGEPPLADGSPFLFRGEPSGFTCAGCHTVNPAKGYFGTNGHQGITGEVQVLKTPQLRNMYQKVGMFGLPNRPGFGELDDNSHQGDQVRGFGFLHDGATDTLSHFMQGAVFVNDDPNSGFDSGAPGMQQRRNVEQYLMAFDNDVAPIVGQQVTIDSQAHSTALARLDLMEARARVPFVSKELGGRVTECDLIAKGVIDGRQRSFLLNPDTGSYTSDIATQAATSSSNLRALLRASGNVLTFTCAPPGAGRRMALDRDSDNVLDGDEPTNQPTPTQPAPVQPTPPRGGGGGGAISHVVCLLLLLGVFRVYGRTAFSGAKRR